MESQQREEWSPYHQLTKYDTIFLVDDSSSMRDVADMGLTPWSNTIQVMTQCAELILKAGGRLKVHFLNSKASKEKIYSVQELRDLCSFSPYGDTPMYERLHQHLGTFLEAMRPLNFNERDAHPGLNLFMFTDGAPEKGFGDIEEVIVDTAKGLRDLGPGKRMLGIQFVQIGDYESVTRFFDYIDNDIKGKHGLAHDVGIRSASLTISLMTDMVVQIVDTVRYDPAATDEGIYTRIILGAIDKKQDRQGSASSNPTLWSRQ